jgi:hypothetical protein
MYRRSVDGDGFIAPETTHPPPHRVRKQESSGPPACNAHMRRARACERVAISAMVAEVVGYLVL